MWKSLKGTAAPHERTPPGVTQYEQAYPAQALDADVVGIGSAWRAIDDPVPELIVGSAARHPAEQLTSVLHQN